MVLAQYINENPEEAAKLGFKGNVNTTQNPAEFHQLLPEEIKDMDEDLVSKRKARNDNYKTAYEKVMEGHVSQSVSREVIQNADGSVHKALGNIFIQKAGNYVADGTFEDANVPPNPKVYAALKKALDKPVGDMKGNMLWEKKNGNVGLIVQVIDPESGSMYNIPLDIKMAAGEDDDGRLINELQGSLNKLAGMTGRSMRQNEEHYSKNL